MNQNGFNAGITGLGVYLPEKRVTEKDFINAGVPKEYIDMWGVYEHRVSEPDETPSDMSIKAAQDLIRNTGIDPKEIDLIIDCALVPDCVLPGNSHKIQCAINAINASGIDILPSNGGVIPHLVVAKALILSGAFDKILITCSSKFSSIMDSTDWSSLVIGGDCAAAALISKVDVNKGILSSNMITKGEFYSSSGIKIKAPLVSKNKGTIYEKNNMNLLFFLDGLNSLLEGDNSLQEELKRKSNEFYLNSVPLSAELALKNIGLAYNSVDFWIMHQNSKSTSEYWLNAMGIREKGNYYFTYNKYGNIFNANLLVNLKEAVDKSFIKENDIVVLSGVIIGLSAGSVVMRWGQ